MKLIVITWPDHVPDEAELISLILERGADYVHIRKPEWNKRDYRRLLEQIPVRWYRRLVLHDHYDLLEEFSLAGFHLNKRNVGISQGRIPFSCSCHSLQEIALYRDKGTEYLFLSPVFDSISKVGYSSAFSDKELKDASEKRIIDESVVALGGISLEKIKQVQAYSFGGIALLGTIWKNYLKTGDKNVLAKTIDDFRNQL